MLKILILAFGIAEVALQTTPQQQAIAKTNSEQQIEVQELNATDAVDAMKLAKSYTDLGLAPLLNIDKDRIFEGQILAVDTLVFQPGTRLVFAGGLGDRNARYIVARTIRIISGDSPVITWDRESSVHRVPPTDTKAPSGSIGGGEGADGTTGSDGQTGNPGIPGRSAPTLYVFISHIEGGPIIVDLSGQDGGPGGQGQFGGDGGPGRAGRQGISGIVDCRSGGANGGSGGKGGNGGKGGPGGRGGNGGTFILLSSQALLERFRTVFQVNVAPGKGGPPGDGGNGGTGALQGKEETEMDSVMAEFLAIPEPTGLMGHGAMLEVMELRVSSP